MLTAVLAVVLAAAAGWLYMARRAQRQTAADLERARATLAVTQDALVRQGRTLVRVMAERDALAMGDAGAAVLRDAVDRCTVYAPEQARFQAVAQALVIGLQRGQWTVRVGEA